MEDIHQEWTIGISRAKSSTGSVNPGTELGTETASHSCVPVHTGAVDAPSELHKCTSVHVGAQLGRACKALYTGSIPVAASTEIDSLICIIAGQGVFLV
jgi:hypothetical protein